MGAVPGSDHPGPQGSVAGARICHPTQRQLGVATTKVQCIRQTEWSRAKVATWKDGKSILGKVEFYQQFFIALVLLSPFRPTLLLIPGWRWPETAWPPSPSTSVDRRANIHKWKMLVVLVQWAFGSLACDGAEHRDKPLVMWRFTNLIPANQRGLWNLSSWLRTGIQITLQSAPLFLLKFIGDAVCFRRSRARPVSYEGSSCFVTSEVNKLHNKYIPSEPPVVLIDK